MISIRISRWHSYTKSGLIIFWGPLPCKAAWAVRRPAALRRPCPQMPGCKAPRHLGEPKRFEGQRYPGRHQLIEPSVHTFMHTVTYAVGFSGIDVCLVCLLRKRSRMSSQGQSGIVKFNIGNPYIASKVAGSGVCDFRCMIMALVRDSRFGL